MDPRQGVVSVNADFNTHGEKQKRMVSIDSMDQAASCAGSLRTR